MLALATLHGWTADGYHLIAHPVQQRVLHTPGELERRRARTTIELGIDGCGLPTFALPLDRVATACARFAAAAADGVAAPARIARRDDRASRICRGHRPAVHAT